MALKSEDVRLGFVHFLTQGVGLGKFQSEFPLSDVIDFTSNGNRLHPKQKPIEALRPLVRAFCKPRGIVLDPFCGSGSTLVAAKDLERNFIGIELDGAHHWRRLEDAKTTGAAA